jgi:hydrogenase maturation factor
MHDVSEGGVKKALLEVSSAHNMKVDVESDLINYVKGADALDQDILKAPSYGALIVVAGKDSKVDIKDICSELDVPVADAGIMGRGEGLYIDGERVEQGGRIAIDEVYGAFKRE